MCTLLDSTINKKAVDVHQYHPYSRVQYSSRKHTAQYCSCQGFLSAYNFVTVTIYQCNALALWPAAD